MNLTDFHARFVNFDTVPLDLKFTGLLLRAALDSGVVLFFIIAVGASVVSALQRSRLGRAWRIAIRAGVLSLCFAAMAAGAFALTEPRGAWNGIEWIDWLAVPALALAGAACWILLSKRAWA